MKWTYSESIDILYRLFGYIRGDYIMNYCEMIKDRIQEILNKGKNRIILYPFGERGKLAKSILNTYFGIDEFMIVDNFLYERYETIKPLDVLGNIDFSDVVVLITSDRTEIHEELCRKLYEYAPKEKCLELFPELIMNSEKRCKMKRDHDRRISIINKVNETKLIDCGMIYNPINTKSRFFLPYVYTDLIQSTIFLTDNYFESRNLEQVFERVKDRNISGTFIDVGANIGNHTLFFANEICGAERIVSFEPMEENYWILEKNIEINGLKNKVESYQIGLSDSDGMAQTVGFYYDNFGGNALGKDENGDIRLTTLDSFGFDDVRFIKIDVEGFEKCVLKGGIDTIKKWHPYILIEIADHNLKDVKDMLIPLGYHCCQINNIDYFFS